MCSFKLGISRRLNSNVNGNNPKNINQNVLNPILNIENKLADNMAPIIDGSREGGNWVRAILQEKTRKIGGCNFHDKCISSEKLKVSRKHLR